MTTASLKKQLAARISSEGPISLADFMQTALYDPQHGYYASNSPKIGAAGDFITNVSVGPLFGALVARQIHEMWRACNQPKEWTLVEQGAYDGRLILDILTALQTHHPALHARLQVILIEPLSSLKARQSATLQNAANVLWKKHLSELEPWSGVHLSNELPDAFPIRRFRWSGEWTEDRVTLSNGHFAFVNQPPDATAEILLRDMPPPPIHRVVEFAADLEPWTQQILDRLSSGYVLAFDYGLLEAEWNQPHRTNGTLRGYRNHRHAENPLADPGQQDITAHVDLSRWTQLLLRHGATEVQITDQHRFCTGVAPLHFPDQIRTMSPAEHRELLQFRSLSHPSLFGSAFRVLAAGKSVPSLKTLSGFRFPL
jgi:SAM-dependent MidA family methyltransferase